MGEETNMGNDARELPSEQEDEAVGLASPKQVIPLPCLDESEQESNIEADATDGARPTGPQEQQPKPQHRSRTRLKCLKSDRPEGQVSSGPHNQAKAPLGLEQTGSRQHGFRSRLSSISGALQHPKLARRFLGGLSGALEQQSQNGGQWSQNGTTIRITTTSFDSPRRQSGESENCNNGKQNEHPEGVGVEMAAAPSSHSRPSSSGRRLSQLFLPQQLMMGGQHPILLNQLQDPFSSNELIPPHLLALYGQPPLVGPTSMGGPGAMSSVSSLMLGQPGSGPASQRTSWADISLLGRLSGSVRPSIDSTLASTACGGFGSLTSQLARHSFDARKYSS